MEEKKTKYSWLPDLILFEEYNNDWHKYEARLYKVFGQTIKSQNFKYEGKTIGYDKKKTDTGREEIFEHLISEDIDKSNPNADRVPDFRRCERLLWIRSIIDNLDSEDISPMIYSQQKSPSDIREVIYIPELEYVIILRKGRFQYFLITAFQVEDQYRRQKFEKNFRRYCDKK